MKKAVYLMQENKLTPQKMTTLAPTKKITIATVKSFIKNNAGSIFVNVKSSFDGMTDGTEQCHGGFQKAGVDADHPSHSFGIKGAWFVGSSRDYINAFENATYKGFEITNSCGRFILAIQK